MRRAHTLGKKVVGCRHSRHTQCIGAVVVNSRQDHETVKAMLNVVVVSHSSDMQVRCGHQQGHADGPAGTGVFRRR